jgi:AraC-like DNA-binding protein
MKRRLLFFVVFLLPFFAFAQIRVEITEHTPFKTANQRLFLACDFNNWQPGDVEFELKRDANGVYSLLLPDSLTHFKYKVTQGSWGLVEGDAEGNSRPDRVYDRLAEPNPKLLQLQIEGWEAHATYRFVVTSIPANTPKDAVIYITGNFNNWNTGDENYRLKRQVDGTYRVTVVSDLDRLEYKFSRGDWNSVEGRENGKTRPNRLLYRNESLKSDNITVEIISWEDLSGTFHSISIYDLLLLFSAFQSALLIIAITSMQDYNRQANRWLVVSLAFMAVVVLIRVVSAYREVAQEYTKWLLIPDFVLFLYAPLFYFYIQKLLFKTPKLPAKWWGHFVLPSLQFLMYLPYFLMEDKSLQIKIVNRDVDLMWLFWGTGTVALMVNVYYWLASRRVIRSYRALYANQASYEQNLQYLSTVLALQAVCLVLWLFSGGLFVVGYFLKMDTIAIVQKSIDTIWLAFSTIPYFLGYFAIHQPEIFKLPTQPISFLNPNDEPTIIIQDALTPLVEKEPELVENLSNYKEKLESYMKKNKPYTNPGLTLNELAQKLKLTPHLLSKIINEGYNKNFFDFINEYRIEEFKLRFEDPRNRQYTMLAIAFEVGFNSKTSFNRAFKKMTQQTPREFFYESRVEE